MGPMVRFLGYAQAFEQTYDDDDWSRLAPFLAADAVYEVRNTKIDCRLQGRDEILRGLKKSLDGFDRRFPKRTLDVTDPPVEDGERMTVGWTATYQPAGVPPFVLRGRSTVRYRDGLIAELVDEYADGVSDALEVWARDHAPGIDASYT